MKYCPNCGCPLKITSWNRYFCPNCGIVDNEESHQEDGEHSYIN